AEALQALEKAVELNPDNAHAHYLMAFVLGDMGRHQEARAASKRAIQLNPPLARAQTNLSLERYNAERRSQQLRARESPEPQVVEGNQLPHYNLGLAFPQRGYYNEALPAYRMGRGRGAARRLPPQPTGEVRSRNRPAQPGAVAVPAAALPAGARGLPPGPGDRAALRRGLERDRPRTGGAEALRRRAQRVRARGRDGPRARGRPLQPELHPLELGR